MIFRSKLFYWKMLNILTILQKIVNLWIQQQGGAWQEAEGCQQHHHDVDCGHCRVPGGGTSLVHHDSASHHIIQARLSFVSKFLDKKRSCCSSYCETLMGMSSKEMKLKLRKVHLSTSFIFHLPCLTQWNMLLLNNSNTGTKTKVENWILTFLLFQFREWFSGLRAGWKHHSVHQLFHLSLLSSQLCHLLWHVKVKMALQ